MSEVKHKKSLSSVAKTNGKGITDEINQEQLSQSYISNQKKGDDSNVINLDKDNPEINNSNINSFFSPAAKVSERVVNISSLDIDNSISNTHEKVNKDDILNEINENKVKHNNEKINLIKNLENRVSYNNEGNKKKCIIIAVTFFGVALFTCMIILFINLFTN